MSTPEELAAEQVEVDAARAAEEQKAQEEAAAAAKAEADEQGVPYKNRFIETERKMNSLNEEKIRLEERIRLLEEQAKPAPVREEEVQEEDWMKVTRNISQHETREILRKERQSMSFINGELNKFEKDEDYGDLVKQYRNEIEDQLNVLSFELRTKPATVEKIVTMVLGGHIKEYKNKFAKPAAGSLTRGTPDSVATSSTGAPAGSGEDKNNLTVDEEQFAKNRGYFGSDKAYTVAEIKANYKRYIERRKK